MTTTMRHPHRLPSTVRRALFDTRLFLKSLNKRSDEIATQRHSPRCYEAQVHYDQAIELINRLDEILK
jgi:hypothetical protein